MNITQEKVSEQSSIITISIHPEDYKEKVEKEIKAQSKKAQLPGFRRGMVPVSHIKRLYGKNILSDELNKQISDSLNGYIADNKLEIIGQPLAQGPEKEYKWNFEDTFQFSYELGLAPSFTVDAPADKKFTHYKVIPDEETITTRQFHLQRAYGKMTAEEISTEDTGTLFGHLEELDEAGAIKAGGFEGDRSIRLESIVDKAIKKSLIGLKKDDQVTIDFAKAVNNYEQLLGIEPEASAAIHPVLRFTIKSINRLDPADLNEEFFTKVFPDGSVKNAEELRAYTVKEISQQTEWRADQLLLQEVQQYFFEHTKVEMPSDFLLRWIASINPEMSQETVEEQFAKFEESMKWELIVNKVIASENAEPTWHDLLGYAMERFNQQYAMYAGSPLPEDQIKKIAEQQLKNDRKLAEELSRQLRTGTALTLLRSKIATEEKEIDFNAFQELK